MPTSDRVGPYRTLFFALAALTWTAAVGGQENLYGDNGDDDPAPDPVIMLFDRLPETLEDWKPERMERAVAIQLFPFAGREDLAVRYAPDNAVSGRCPPLPGAPVKTISAKAEDAQIVIVNEAHDQPLHRWVIREVGLALADDFDVFAAETFAAEALQERRQGTVTDSLGHYSDEPIFARELRALDEAGYRFVAYEIRDHQRIDDDADTADKVVAREEAQAENLIADVLADDPDARILVHVGYSHALEAPVNNFGREIEWFAARLKRKTGIDPLTVSQTHCSVDDEDRADALSGLQLADGSDAVLAEGAIDLFVAHPSLVFEDGRPSWRRVIGDIAVPVPPALRPDDARVIIEARAPGRPLDELPVDRLLLYPGESLPLLLPSGTWRLHAWTPDSGVRNGVDVTVGES